MNEGYCIVIEYGNNQYDIMLVDIFETYEEAEAEAKASCESDGSYIYYIMKLIPCAKVHIPNPDVVVEKF